MGDLHPNDATRVPSAEPRHLLGTEARRRFDFKSWGRHRSSALGSGFKPGVGSLAAQTHLFNAVIGRSMASRSMIGQRLLSPAAGPGRLPVRPPEEYFPVADERRRFTVSQSEAERRNHTFMEIQARMSGVRRSAGKLPPAGLPRATSRASQSRMGRQTGPAGAGQRMAGEPAYVSNPGDVRGAGRLVSSRDRLTVEPRNASAQPPPAGQFTWNMAAPRAMRIQRGWAPDAPFQSHPQTKAIGAGQAGPGAMLPSRPTQTGRPLPGHVAGRIGRPVSSSAVLGAGRWIPSGPPLARSLLMAGPTPGLPAGGAFPASVTPARLLRDVRPGSALRRASIASTPVEHIRFSRVAGGPVEHPLAALAKGAAPASALARAVATSSAVHAATGLPASPTPPFSVGTPLALFLARAPLTPHAEPGAPRRSGRTANTVVGNTVAGHTVAGPATAGSVRRTSVPARQGEAWFLKRPAHETSDVGAIPSDSRGPSWLQTATTSPGPVRGRRVVPPTIPVSVVQRPPIGSSWPTVVPGWGQPANLAPRPPTALQRAPLAVRARTVGGTRTMGSALTPSGLHLRSSGGRAFPGASSAAAGRRSRPHSMTNGQSLFQRPTTLPPIQPWQPVVLSMSTPSVSRLVPRAGPEHQWLAGRGAYLPDPPISTGPLARPTGVAWPGSGLALPWAPASRKRLAMPTAVGPRVPGLASPAIVRTTVPIVARTMVPIVARASTPVPARTTKLIAGAPAVPILARRAAPVLTGRAARLLGGRAAPAISRATTPALAPTSFPTSPGAATPALVGTPSVASVQVASRGLAGLVTLATSAVLERSRAGPTPPSAASSMPAPSPMLARGRTLGRGGFQTGPRRRLAGVEIAFAPGIRQQPAPRHYEVERVHLSSATHSPAGPGGNTAGAMAGLGTGAMARLLTGAQPGGVLMPTRGTGRLAMSLSSGRALSRSAVVFPPVIGASFGGAALPSSPPAHPFSVALVSGGSLLAPVRSGGRLRASLVATGLAGASARPAGRHSTSPPRSGFSDAPGTRVGLGRLPAAAVRSGSGYGHAAPTAPPLTSATGPRLAPPASTARSVPPPGILSHSLSSPTARALAFTPLGPGPGRLSRSYQRSRSGPSSTVTSSSSMSSSGPSNDVTGRSTERPPVTPVRDLGPAFVSPPTLGSQLRPGLVLAARLSSRFCGAVNGPRCPTARAAAAGSHLPRTAALPTSS